MLPDVPKGEKRWDNQGTRLCRWIPTEAIHSDEANFINRGNDILMHR